MMTGLVRKELDQGLLSEKSGGKDMLNCQPFQVGMHRQMNRCGAQDKWPLNPMVFLPQHVTYPIHPWLP